MDIKSLDLNLLRVFDAVYRHRSVSRAAEELGLSQPATSQAVTRLRLLLGNPLFERVHAGVRPTPRAERLALAVRQALETLEVAMSEAQSFEPAQARQRFRIHLSDIGEARFLPPLMQALHQRAPHVQLETLPMPMDEIADALDRGALDIAIGFLPGNTRTQQAVLLSDHYAVLLREGHPALDPLPADAPLDLATLGRLDYVAVRSHAETLRILQALQLQDRIRLSAAHFMAVPSIVVKTDLAVVMPAEIAQGFVGRGHTVRDAALPQHRFDVSLHWSWRFEQEPAKRWLRELVCELFQQPRYRTRG